MTLPPHALYFREECSCTGFMTPFSSAGETVKIKVTRGFHLSPAAMATVTRNLPRQKIHSRHLKGLSLYEESFGRKRNSLNFNRSQLWQPFSVQGRTNVGSWKLSAWSCMFWLALPCADVRGEPIYIECSSSTRELTMSWKGKSLRTYIKH